MIADQATHRGLLRFAQYQLLFFECLSELRFKMEGNTSREINRQEMDLGILHQVSLDKIVKPCNYNILYFRYIYIC